MIMRKTIAIYFSFFLFLIQVAGQERSSEQQPTNRIYGKVIDASTKKGIEAASIQLYTFYRNSADNSIKDTLAGGMLTRPNGDFNLENLPSSDSIRIEITAIGFKDHWQVLIVGRSGLRERDLGNIALEIDSKYLSTVTVVGQKPALELGVDRKTFNVDKSIVSTGGTAIDVMKNIPSVSVDV